jgi:hypothetical protein
VTHRIALVTALVALACATAPEELSPQATAQVALEIWPGFASPAEWPPARPARVEILLDLTLSMQTPTRGGPPRYAAAREAAARLLEILPEETPVGVRALGIARGAECVAATQVAGGSAGRLRPGLPRHLRVTEPAAEGSLAGALEALQRDLSDEIDGTRIVLFTDLDAACGGDLCAAGAALAAQGARFDLVLLSEAEVPDCFADFAPHVALRDLPPTAALRVPDFRVEGHRTGSTKRGPVLARGSADGGAVRVPAGPALLVVSLEPQALVGPMLLTADTLTRVRILEFPGLHPPVREWRWDVEPLADPAVERSQQP